MESMHEYVLERLQDCKGDWPEVARKAGVSYRTLKKIATGVIASPGVRIVEKIAAYFRSIEALEEY